jgi:hypothetical protein
MCGPCGYPSLDLRTRAEINTASLNMADDVRCGTSIHGQEAQLCLSLMYMFRQGGGGAFRRQGTRDDAKHAGPLPEHPLEEHPGDAAGADRDLRREDGEARAAAGAAGRVGVEAKPADPKHGAANHGVEHVVGFEVLDADALAGANDDGRGEARHAGADVDYVVTGIV